MNNHVPVPTMEDRNRLYVLIHKATDPMIIADAARAFARMGDSDSETNLTYGAFGVLQTALGEQNRRVAQLERQLSVLHGLAKQPCAVDETLF